MYIWLMMIFVFVVVAFILLTVAVGGLLGVFLGGIVGAITGRMQVPEADKELATYRGITWGSCLGALVGTLLALISLLLAWPYM